MEPGTKADPKYIADAWYEMYTKQEKAEDTYLVPSAVTKQLTSQMLDEHRAHLPEGFK